MKIRLNHSILLKENNIQAFSMREELDGKANAIQK